MEQNFEKGFIPDEQIPIGGVILAKDELEFNKGRYTTTVKVKNRGSRPIQVGSHYHFFEVNRYLEFDREAAFGMHLNIPATTAIRFEPGEEKSVELVAFGGKQYICGFNGLVDGYTGSEDAPFYLPKKSNSIAMAERYGFMNCKEETTPKNK